MKAPRFFLKLKGLNLRRSYLSWQERSRRGALLRYYVNKPKEDARSVLGKGLDMLAGLVLIWSAGFLLVFGLTGEVRTALVFSAPLAAAGALLARKILKHGLQKRRLQKKLWAAGQKIAGDISSMSSRNEFVSYVRDILAGLPGFFEAGGKTKEKEPAAAGNGGIDLVGLYNGVPLAVRCRFQRGGENAGPPEIRDFAVSLELAGYKNGLYITSGDFVPGVLPAVREAARKGINIKPVNCCKLIDLARRAGFGAFGAEESGQPGGREKSRRRAGIGLFLDFALASRKKAGLYMFCGLLLWGGHVVLKGSTPLSLLYLFFAVLNLAAGACSLIYCKTLEGEDPLEGLEVENRR
ncbi:MAG TPA: restriction endonuclease [Bacillota bacterium]|nr:restriction endonuclease [Bacillota bacterium]